VGWGHLNILLAVGAGVVCVLGLAGGDSWRTVTGGTCLVVFGLLAAGVPVFGRTSRAWRRLRDESRR
jgi:hypothetical protein